MKNDILLSESSIFVENIFMINAVVIEGENRTLDIIVRTIETYSPNVSIASQANDMKSGISAINEHEPDLVLLDIKLNDGSGFELIDHFNPPDFKIIFFSSYTDYAIKAIRYNAVDYILRPVKEDLLAQAIRKADDLIRYEEKLHLKALGESIKNLNNDHRLILKSSDQIHLINTSDIIHIKADGNYSTFYLTGDRKIVISKSIREFEETLFNQGFHRIHKSHLVNINQMTYFDKANGGTLVMSNNDEIPVASRKRDMLMELFDNLTQ